MYIAWSLASALSTALYLVYVSGLLKANRFLHPQTALLGTHLAGAVLMLCTLPLLPGIDITLPREYTGYLYLLLNASLLMLSRQLYFYAYANTDVANITIFSPLTPLFGIVTAHLLLGETLTPQETFGTLLISVSIYWMFLRRSPGVSTVRTLLSPFSRIAESRAIFCGFLSTIPTAFGAVFQKQALQYFDPATFTLLLFAVMAVMAAVIEMGRHRSLSTLKQPKLHWWVLSGMLLLISQIIFCYILISAPTAVALVLQRFSIVFQVILAYFFLKEKSEMGKRVLCSAGAIAGFALLVYKQLMP